MWDSFPIQDEAREAGAVPALMQLLDVGSQGRQSLAVSGCRCLCALARHHRQNQVRLLHVAPTSFIHTLLSSFFQGISLKGLLPSWALVTPFKCLYLLGGSCDAIQMLIFFRGQL